MTVEIFADDIPGRRDVAGMDERPGNTVHASMGVVSVSYSFEFSLSGF